MPFLANSDHSNPRQLTPGSICHARRWPWLSVSILTTFCHIAAAQDCIAPPRQTAPFIGAAVTAKMSALGIGKDGNAFAVRVGAGLRDLYRDLPNADKLVVMQALLSQSCEIIKSLSISPDKKIAKYIETQQHILNLFNDADSSLKPGNLKYAVSAGCYSIGLRKTWQTSTDLVERSTIRPPAGSPEAAVGLELAVRPYFPQKSGVAATLKEKLGGPASTPTNAQLVRYLKETYENWDSDTCCERSEWMKSATSTVVATDDLASRNPNWEPREGLMMTYRRDSKIVQAVAYFAASTSDSNDRLGGVWAECRVNANASTAYASYCAAILSQFRFTASPPRCNASFIQARDRGQLLDSIPPPSR